MKEITIVFQTNNIKTKFTVHRDKGMKLYISNLIARHVSGMTLRKFHRPKSPLFCEMMWSCKMSMLKTKGSKTSASEEIQGRYSEETRMLKTKGSKTSASEEIQGRYSEETQGNCLCNLYIVLPFSRRSIHSNGSLVIKTSCWCDIYFCINANTLFSNLNHHTILFERRCTITIYKLHKQKLVECSELTRNRRSRDRMVVGFTIFITETRGVLWIN
jgi:hypothetical protein